MESFSACFSVIDSHTAGHPTRVILSGVPPLKGVDVRARRDDFRARFDHLRPALLHEPRGHAAMVGLVPVPSAVADYGAFFISSYVYLDMCGHGTMGFARTLAHSGEISAATGNGFTLETPAGVVGVGLAWSPDGTLDKVRIRNVPSYVGLTGVSVEVAPFGAVRADIVYGGMWYALVEAGKLGLDLVPDNATGLLRAGAAIKEKLKEVVRGNPLFEGSPAPSVLFYREEAPDTAVHFLVLDSNKFDRSPCGTGTAARMTHLLESGRLAPSATYVAKNIFGIPFEARLAEEARVDGHPAAIIEVSGNAFITSTQTIVFEANDPLTSGFLCR